MSANSFHSAAVIGTGMMGPGIALTFSLAGIPATIVSRTEESAAEGLRKARAQLEVLVENELVESASAEGARGLLRTSTDVKAAAGEADLVVESGPERLAWKQDLFRELEQVTPPNAVLASNTSGLSITSIAAECTYPERVVTTHFWNPPHLVPLVEIVKGLETGDDTVERVYDFLLVCGKAPVIVKKDRPGQLGNRLQQALIREAAYIIAEGIATAEDIDVVLKRGLGLRYPAYGLMEHQDNVGLELCRSICEYVSPDLYRSEYAPAYLTQLVEQGRLGASTGRGFLTWKPGEAEAAKARRDTFLIEFLRRERGRQKAASEASAG